MIDSPSSRKTMTTVALAAAAVAVAIKGKKRRERVIAATGDAAAAAADDDTAAKSMPHAGAMTSMLTRLLLALRKWVNGMMHITRYSSHVTRHTSHVTCHTSHVTRHTSHVTRHTSHVTRQRHLPTNASAHDRTEGKQQQHIAITYLTASFRSAKLFCVG